MRVLSNTGRKYTYKINGFRNLKNSNVHTLVNFAGLQINLC